MGFWTLIFGIYGGGDGEVSIAVVDGLTIPAVPRGVAIRAVPRGVATEDVN